MRGLRGNLLGRNYEARQMGLAKRRMIAKLEESRSQARGGAVRSVF